MLCQGGLDRTVVLSLLLGVLTLGGLAGGRIDALIVFPPFFSCFSLCVAAGRSSFVSPLVEEESAAD
jgi:hypothetical protein